jgi:hypothetical protein
MIGSPYVPLEIRYRLKTDIVCKQNVVKATYRGNTGHRDNTCRENTVSCKQGARKMRRSGIHAEVVSGRLSLPTPPRKYD